MQTRRPQITKDRDGNVLIERFSPLRRVEHIVVMITFVALLLTGFPQKLHGEWSIRLIALFGGLDTTRSIHRIFGLIFTAHAAVHVLGIVIGVLSRQIRLTLLPVPQDLRDAWNNLSYYLGMRKQPPKLPKFDYRQKFEYVGIVLGGLVMVFSGLALMYPIFTASVLPGQVIPAARMAHSNEALLALLVLVVWHVYGAHLSPEVFPMDKSIFNGQLSAEELRERHTLEYERLFDDRTPEQLAEQFDTLFVAGDQAAESEAGTNEAGTDDKPPETR